ncbi:hypothetical protein [Phytohabitans houttuyneae]|uniref:hypothetical protein n=1 Tax=Phytohabitans houttuyneae TaxID=1076126 RepID=UPI001563B817|nr:hypothetical protein [Phytohabitans houttuyneae]
MPLLLMAGTPAAEALQPAGFDPLKATLSDMAGLDAAHREVLTGVIIGMGFWYIVIARWLTVVGMAAARGRDRRQRRPVWTVRVVCGERGPGVVDGAARAHPRGRPGDLAVRRPHTKRPPPP